MGEAVSYLRGVDVTGRPSDGGAQRDERLHEDGGLGCDVRTGDDFSVLQGLVILSALS